MTVHAKSLALFERNGCYASTAMLDVVLTRKSDDPAAKARTVSSNMEGYQQESKEIMKTLKELLAMNEATIEEQSTVKLNYL